MRQCSATVRHAPAPSCGLAAPVDEEAAHDTMGEVKAALLDEFVRSPVARLVRGNRYLVWCATPDLWGTVLWGAPSEEDLRALCALWNGLRSLPGPFDIVSDNHRLATVDPLPFGIFLDYALAHRDELERKTRSHAVVRPIGPMESSTIGGLSHLLRPAFRWTITDSARCAFEWLDRADALRIGETIEAAVEEARGASLFVTNARAYLIEHPRATLDMLSAHLKVSRRSAQRRLGDGGVTFRELVESVRVERAKLLLAGGDNKIDEVARRSGYQHGSHLARAFRKQGLARPSTHRRR